MTLDLVQRLPADFGMWPAVLQAGILFGSTFLLEDVAAVGAGALLATGALTWPTAFLGCFLGIWIGDAGLYALARLVGRRWFERTPLRRFSHRVERSERWFAERGDAILILSRLLPGARLPTYLAAGFLRLPLPRFLLVTGCAAMVWTLMVLGATQFVGARLSGWFGTLEETGWLMLGMVALVLAAMHATKRFATASRLKHIATWFARWKHWEFWPPWLFYPPVALYYLYLGLKYRCLTLPTVANPGIFSGGVIGESKMATLQPLMDASPEFTAEAERLRGSTPAARLASLRQICRRRQITYPFILKPDIGQRGAGVKLIRSEAQAVAYLERTPAPLIVQRYAPGPYEVGVFYYRFPHEVRGHVFCISEKLFPCVTGDGQSTISELVWNDPRARFMAGTYLQRLAGRQDEVLPRGATLRLVEAGNHAQGCIFQDGRRLYAPGLAERIDAISRRILGFYVGRYDIRYSSEADLRAGKSFQIVELNGAASEATSIYDARHSLFTAYRTLFRQWDLVFAIGAANRSQGRSSMKALVLWQKWREYARQASTYPAAD